MSEQSNYPTSNSGSEYFNLNICRSFIQPVGTATVAISGAGVNGWPCSEVIIKNLNTRKDFPSAIVKEHVNWAIKEQERKSYE